MMYDIIITVAVFVLLLLISFSIIFYIRRKTKQKTSLFIHVIICFLSVILITVISSLVYFGIYYHADNDAKNALISTDICTVKNTNEGYIFDGPGNTAAMIFYPGAKVETESYAPLMQKISSEGIDCFLLKMPLNFALLGKDRASSIIDSYPYEKWIMSGHSLGGAAASMYAAENSENISGLILFASYSTEPVNDNICVLSLYGSNDLVLNKDAYDKYASSLPPSFDEYIIQGGNHSGFGNYGSQRGDGNASISSDEQQKISAEKISELYLKSE